MKRINILICIVLVLQMFCSCTADSEDFENPVNFYYCKEEISYNSASGVIHPETRDGSNFHGNLTACLRAYLLGPETEVLVSPIPKDVYLVSCSVDGDVAELVFSTQFSKLSGVKLTTACSAILMTLHDYTGVQMLKISAKDSTLDGHEYIEMHLDEIVLLDAVSVQE